MNFFVNNEIFMRYLLRPYLVRYLSGTVSISRFPISSDQNSVRPWLRTARRWVDVVPGSWDRDENDFYWSNRCAADRNPGNIPRPKTTVESMQCLIQQRISGKTLTKDTGVWSPKIGVVITKYSVITKDGCGHKIGCSHKIGCGHKIGLITKLGVVRKLGVIIKLGVVTKLGVITK